MVGLVMESLVSVGLVEDSGEGEFRVVPFFE